MKSGPEPGPVSDCLRLFTLNVSGPSLERADRLREFLIGLDADALVLTETRQNAGTAFLMESLAGVGYEVCSPMPQSSRERGVALLSRGIASEREASPALGVDLSHRLVVGEMGALRGLKLVAAYVPSRDASELKIERKRTFLSQMQGVLRQATCSGPVVLLGDLNVVGQSHEPHYPVFRSWEYEALEDVARHGLVDAFDELHPGVQEHSWIGRTGNGYRYDYAFVSQELADRIQACDYLHAPRECGLSDHAGLMLSLSLPRLRSMTKMGALPSAGVGG